MDNIYYIALFCWLSGAFLLGRWSYDEHLPPRSGFYRISTLSGINSRAPLYHHDNIWRYRVPGGPWVYPSWPDLIAHAQTENGDPLIEE